MQLSTIYIHIADTMTKVIDIVSYRLLGGIDSGVARVELVRGPVPGVARFYRLRSGSFARIAINFFAL